MPSRLVMNLQDSLPQVFGYPEEPIPAEESLDSFLNVYNLEIRSIVGRASMKLSNKQAQVLRLRFSKEMTLKQVGAHFGVGQERIRRLQNEALQLLRKEIVDSYTTREREFSFT